MVKGQGIIGDNQPMQLPQTDVPQRDIEEEKKIAKFKQSDEFKRLEEYIQLRVNYYQNVLPSGTSVAHADKNVDLNIEWKVANLVIMELTTLLEAYDNVEQAVKNLEKYGRTNPETV